MDRLLSMRVFERVVNEGGFAAAARALDMSAPVVTRLVADLEAHLGTRLLQRTTRHLSLTDAGQNYLLRVHHILQDIDEAHSVASSDTTALAGLLRLHASPLLASYVIAPLLAEFRRLHPTIQIDIEVEASKVPPIEDYDITLLGTDDSFDADVVARKVIESDAILVASPDYLKRRGRPQDPEELAHHESLRLKSPGGRPRIWRMWRPDNPEQVVEVDPLPMLLSNHTFTLFRATLDGAGIMSVSVNLAAAHLTSGELVRVLPQWVTGRMALYAALPSRKFIPQRTRVFLDYLVAETQRNSALALQACTGSD